MEVMTTLAQPPPDHNIYDINELNVASHACCKTKTSAASHLSLNNLNSGIDKQLLSLMTQTLAVQVLITLSR
jgi:hypothetical protein